MNKTIISILILTFLLLSFGEKTTEAKVDTEVIPQNQFPSLLERAFLRSLGGTILDIMQNNGDNQLFENERIEKVSGKNPYDVTLRVIGFEGAHGPPYKLIRMTIRIPDDEGNADYRILSYSSRHITDKRFEELTKYATYD